MGFFYIQKLLDKSANLDIDKIKCNKCIDNINTFYMMNIRQTERQYVYYHHNTYYSISNFLYCFTDNRNTYRSHIMKLFKFTYKTVVGYTPSLIFIGLCIYFGASDSINKNIETLQDGVSQINEMATSNNSSFNYYN